MKQYFVLPFACMALWGCGGQDQIETPPLKIIDQIDFSHVHIRDNFWSPRLAKHTSATLPVCIDQIENQTGRMQNFENAARGTGKHSGIFFDDSDVYKALEGIAYSLINNPDPELEKKADEWIDKIAAAQQPDGYINTFYTLTGQDKRWNNMDKHEMYCAGHMMEAAVAYYQATGKRKLLDVSIRMADHMMELFGPDKRHWVPGHEEIELALVKIYRTTGQEKYLDFANWLLEERGHGHGSMGGEGKWDPAYYQDVIPVRELTDISGHAVRCMYLYCGMADVAALKKDTAYVEALNRLWDDVVLRNMYVTGGIGSSRHNEGFTEDYDLPNLDAYCETCASVGMVYWNQRMNQFTGDSKYIDVLERSMYNGALAGVSLAGDRFFYVNPLEVNPGVSGEIFGYKHVIPERPGWYACACCPPNLVRMVTSLGKYAWDEDETAVYSHLFLGQEAALGKADIRVESAYPWEGSVTYHVSAKIDELITLAIHIPAYVKDLRVTVNGEAFDTAGEIRDGYLYISRKWGSDDQVELHFPLPVRKIYASTHVREDVGCVALMRGSVVYCFEGADNGAYLQALAVKKELDAKALVCTEGKLSGLTLLDVAGIRLVPSEELYTEEPPKEEAVTLRAIPYFAWGNRGLNQMRVWMHEK